MKAHLCKCNNCGTIFYDENPRIGAKEIELEPLACEVLPMELLNDGVESFWGCSECETDEYLTDL